MTVVSYVIVIFLIVNGIGNAVARSKNSKMPAQAIKLYYVPPSPPCRSVMMTAKAIGVELDLNLTNIMEGQHLTPEYIKMNPQHTVPTMDDNGFILWESRAIMAYLVNAYGRDDSLYPKNPRLRAIVDQRLNFDIGTLFSRYLNVYLPVLFRGEEISEESIEKLNEALGWLNTMLEGRTFVAGDNLSIADISIVVTFTNLEIHLGYFKLGYRKYVEYFISAYTYILQRTEGIFVRYSQEQNNPPGSLYLATIFCVVEAFGHDFSDYENITEWFARTKKALEPYGYKEIDYAGGQILASFLNKQKE